MVCAGEAARLATPAITAAVEFLTALLVDQPALGNITQNWLGFRRHVTTVGPGEAAVFEAGEGWQRTVTEGGPGDCVLVTRAGELTTAPCSSLAGVLCEVEPSLSAESKLGIPIPQVTPHDETV